MPQTQSRCQTTDKRQRRSDNQSKIKKRAIQQAKTKDHIRTRATRQKIRTLMFRPGSHGQPIIKGPREHARSHSVRQNAEVG